jgi:hypothetical protein
MILKKVIINYLFRGLNDNTKSLLDQPNLELIDMESILYYSLQKYSIFSIFC